MGANWPRVMASSEQPEPASWFENSVLVVAHPDDEVLWFSSILAQVARVVVCYEACAELPGLSAGRQQAALAYPLANVSWLRLAEPCSLSHVDWSRPLASAHGMALDAEPIDPVAQARYEQSYATLRAELALQLSAAKHVFTHNPWGEYGHPDHVQVCRVVSDLRPELGFRLWHSSYVSPRSAAFAARSLPQLTSHVRLRTDPALATQIQAVYTAHGCWTWHEDFQRFPEEALLERTEQPAAGGGVPLNCVLF
jgi:LmbE family N-acetylglucosaminyl deacetylase